MDRKRILSFALLAALMGGTLFFLLRQQPISTLAQVLRSVRPGYVALGLGLMFCFVGCEALCTKLILGRLGHIGNVWATPSPASM